MGDSILLSIKKLLGIGDDYKYFDEDIIMHINSVFMILNQLGIGPEAGILRPVLLFLLHLRTSTKSLSGGSMSWSIPRVNKEKIQNDLFRWRCLCTGQ